MLRFNAVAMILGWLFVLVSLGMAYMMLSQRGLSASDLIEKTGILAEDPLLLKDEYQTKNVSMRLPLRGETTSLSIPGKLLRVAT